jgi:hypothetical protein
MKTLAINTRIFAIAVIAFFAVAVSTPAIANDDTKKPVTAELKYLGEFKSHPVFELNFNTEENSDYIVVIRDSNQNVVYKDVVKNGVASKRYVLNTDEIGDEALQFEITNKKSAKSVVYEINRNIVYVNDVVVNKLK